MFMSPPVLHGTGGCRCMEELKVKISVKVLPNDYTCDGEDRSPEITVGGVNTGISKCLAIMSTIRMPPVAGDLSTGLPGISSWSGSSRKDPEDSHGHVPVKSGAGKEQFRKDRVQRALSPAWPDPPVLLQTVRAGYRAPASCRCDKRRTRCSHAGPRGPVRRDLCHVRQVTCRSYCTHHELTQDAYRQDARAAIPAL